MSVSAVVASEKARGHRGTSGHWLYTLRGKSQLEAYYGGWRRSRNYSGYLSASLLRAVSKRAVRHISVSRPRAPVAPRLKKDDMVSSCRNAAWSCFLLDCERLLFYFVATYHHYLNASPRIIKAQTHHLKALSHPCFDIQDANTSPHSSAPAGGLPRKAFSRKLLKIEVIRKERDKRFSVQMTHWIIVSFLEFN